MKVGVFSFENQIEGGFARNISKNEMKIRVKNFMNYMDKNGLVGKYKGKDVYIVDYDNLKPEWKHDKDTIYAVRTNRHNYLDLVLDGVFIGQMTNGGSITLFGVNKGYPWPKLKVEYKSEPVVEQGPDMDVSDGYAQYSKVVDNFFKGLDKLWQELEVG